MNQHLKQAINTLRSGGVIAYPTESVFGLGCDPFNLAAVERILNLKQRAIDKGLIVIGSDWMQLAPLTNKIPDERMQAVQQTWPGPVTWIFPKSHLTPHWLSGKFDSIALRVTAHPIAKSICEAFPGGIVSTSANIATEAPARSAKEVAAIFGDEIDFIFDADVGLNPKPTDIFDALSGKQLR